MNLRITITLILALLLFTACGDDSEQLLAPDGTRSIDSSVISDYQIYTEKTLSQRAVSFDVFQDVSVATTLSGSQLNDLHLMLQHYLDNLELKNSYEEKYQYLIANTDNYSRQDRFELIMISLSAMLMTYDDYFLIYSQYYEDTKLRGILNGEDSAYNIPENTLDSIKDEYYLEETRTDLMRLISYYDLNKDDHTGVKDPFFLYLQQLIEGSPSYQLEFNELSFIDDLLNTLVDARDDIYSSIFSGVSSGIGNTAGLVETRKGYLYDDPMVTEIVKTTLKIGDLLLEKTPFRLTDSLIPGYYGHIAVYIGTQTELEALGIWDEPIVQKYIAEIQNSQLIAEALRDGVQLNTVEHFLNIDDLVIMHDTVETVEEKKARIILTLEQLGKEYDYEYDVEDSTKIICSELIYVTYFSVDWQTEVVFGVETISPDNIVVKALEADTIFTIPLMYYDGDEIYDDKVTLIQELLDSSD